jgi:hypothetical protein
MNHIKMIPMFKVLSIIWDMDMLHLPMPPVVQLESKGVNVYLKENYAPMVQ